MLWWLRPTSSPVIKQHGVASSTLMVASTSISLRLDSVALFLCEMRQRSGSVGSCQKFCWIWWILSFLVWVVLVCFCFCFFLFFSPFEDQHIWSIRRQKKSLVVLSCWKLFWLAGQTPLKLGPFLLLTLIKCYIWKITWYVGYFYLCNVQCIFTQICWKKQTHDICCDFVMILCLSLQATKHFTCLFVCLFWVFVLVVGFCHKLLGPHQNKIFNSSFLLFVIVIALLVPRITSLSSLKFSLKKTKWKFKRCNCFEYAIEVVTPWWLDHAPFIMMMKAIELHGDHFDHGRGLE